MSNDTLKSLQKTADTCFKEKRFAEALAALREYLHIISEQPPASPVLKGRILSNIGIIQVESKQYQAAIENFKAAIQVFNTADDNLGEALQWGNIGSSHRDLAEYDDAVCNYQKALGLYEKIGHTLGAADQCTNIAYAYAMNQQLDKAQKMYHQAAALYEKIKDEQKVAMTRKNIAAIEKMT